MPTAMRSNRCSSNGRAHAAMITTLALAALAAFVPQLPSAVASPEPSLPAAAVPQPVGVVSHINLVSDKSEDISTLEAWKKTYIKNGMSKQEKAIAIFNTIVRYRHQANPPKEYLTSELAGG